jgi:hypothetical protein
MGAPKFKLTTLEVLEFALEGVQTAIGTNLGNPTWTAQDWEFHYRSEREIERRIKIMKTQEALAGQKQNTK